MLRRYVYPNVSLFDVNMLATIVIVANFNPPESDTEPTNL